MSSPLAATDFRRGDVVRYIGENDHKGLTGTVRGLDRWTGESKVDVDFNAGGRKIRKIVAPENIEKIEAGK